MHKMHTLYVLKLAGGRYYVGATTRLHTRINCHLRGLVSEWTRRYAAKLLVSSERVSAAAAWDAVDARVFELMVAHGIDRVRGGSYASVRLSGQVQAELRAKIKDGNYGECTRCGLPTHSADVCISERDVDGAEIDDDDSVCRSPTASI